MTPFPLGEGGISPLYIRVLVSTLFLKDFILDTQPITQMPNLCKQLGKSGTDRIRAATLDLSSVRDTRYTIVNTVQKSMQCFHSNMYGEVSEILHNIAQNSDGLKALNVSRIYVIFQCLGKIDTRRVARICDLSDKQAKQYVRACRIALPYLEQYFNQDYDDDPIINEGDYFAL